MAVTAHASGSVTIATTTANHLVTSPDTTAGAFQLMLDLNDMIAADQLDIRIIEKVRNSTGTQRVVWYDTVANVQGEEKAWVSPVIMLLNGWDMTLTMPVGGATVLYSIRKA